VAETFQPRTTIEITSLIISVRRCQLTSEASTVAFVVPATEFYVFFQVYLLSALILESREYLRFKVFQINASDIFEFHPRLPISYLKFIWVGGGSIRHSLLVFELLHLFIVQQHIFHGLGT
jgi:hypothetical protein